MAAAARRRIAGGRHLSGDAGRHPAILTAAAFHAREKFAVRDGTRESRSALTFRILMQAIWAALTIVFVGSDLFNLYVALELLTFAAVPLVCIDGRPETLAAALRYLLFALFGSISYLLGVALFYRTLVGRSQGARREQNSVAMVDFHPPDTVAPSRMSAWGRQPLRAL
jgi:NADH:ubiquinone oxidoreductase subunit 2 (subunit N)